MNIFLSTVFYGKSEVPLTTEEASIMLTPSERGALHNYIIKTAKEQHKVHGVETDTLLTADFQEIVKKKALGMYGYTHITWAFN